VIAFAGAQPSDDEIAAIVAALAWIETPVQVASPPPSPSPWKMAGREYEQQDDRCLARF
jgi:hypothetical protein